jgi:mannan endo-1,4-beta-mannosidase
MLNGGRFFYGGNNIYFLSTMSDTARMHRIIDSCVKYNITVIRTWGFKTGDPKIDKTVLQGPTPNDYNEEGFKNFDYMLKLGGEHNIRFIIPFVNNWTGGKDWYVSKLLNDSININRFWVDSICKSTYKNYIHYIVNRKNSYTNNLYKNDSSIFSWQLCNEPRRNGVLNANNDSGATIYNWIEEMAKFIKSIDPYHLVSTGEEGAGTYGVVDATIQEGVYFKKNSACAFIDFATVHLYPQHWGGVITPWTNDQCANYLLKKANEVSSLDVPKPIVLEEFGLYANFLNIEQIDSLRVNSYKSYIENAIKFGYKGFNPWLMSDCGVSDDDAWGFSFDEKPYTAGGVITKYARLLLDSCEKRIRNESNYGSIQFNSFFATINKNGIITFDVNIPINDNEHVYINILDLRGKRIKQLNTKFSNFRKINWNGKLDNAINLRFGTYICELTIPNINYKRFSIFTYLK